MKRKRTESGPASFAPSQADIEGKPLVRTARDYGPGAWAATADGDCMEPAVANGSLIIFSPSAPLVDGCVCCIETHEGERSLKRLYDAGSHWIARPDNAAYAPFILHKSSVKFITRAVWTVPVVDGKPDERAGYCIKAPKMQCAVKQIMLMPLFTQPPRMSAGG